MKLLILVVAFLSAMLSGCAIPTTGVVPRGDDMYTVTRQGGSFLVTTESLKVAAIQEADAYCTFKGKKYKFMYNKDIPAGAFGRWPESEVLFKCE
jgi:hypothetical protein